MNMVDTIISRSVERTQEGVVSLRFGMVTAVSGATITVNLGDVNVPGVSCLSSYTPKVNDRAWLLNQGSLLVAVGCTKAATEGDSHA
jgi:hypothetical protein